MWLSQRRKGAKDSHLPVYLLPLVNLAALDKVCMVRVVRTLVRV
jgi:hypothetical protein